MFNFKYEIQLPNNEKTWLFGDDYYNDKKVFWDTHQKCLRELDSKVSSIGFPLRIKDLILNTELLIITEHEFTSWLKDTQPY